MSFHISFLYLRYDLERSGRRDASREHAFFPLEPFGLLVADPFDDVVEMAYQTHIHAHVLDMHLDPQGHEMLAAVEIGVVERAVGDEDLVVAEDLAEDRSLVGQHLVLVHGHQRFDGVARVEADRDVVAREEPVVQDDHVLFGGVLLGADEALDALVFHAGVAVEERRGHHAPAREFVDVVGAAFSA